MSLSDIQTIFADIDRIDWEQLGHAYGKADDVPAMLWKSVSDSADEQQFGWEGIWGALNHQGDFYDSTVATIPFFVRFAGCEDVGGRAKFLAYLYGRYLDAADHGGDPLLDAPLVGSSNSTPLADEDRTSQDSDSHAGFCMELYAWQCGRAIRDGLPVYKSLLNHPDREIAGSAANLMLLWPESRDTAKGSLRAAIDAETNPETKAELLLHYGVYGCHNDLEAFRYWTAPSEPLLVRTAAAICWGRVIAPAPLPTEVLTLLREATLPDCPEFVRLPWLGVYNRGPWTLPNNLAHLLIPLAANHDDEIRWRAVQGMMPGKKVEQWLRRDETCPVLAEALSDSRTEIRHAAALALAEIGSEVLEHCPQIIDRLITAVDDQDAGVCGHSSRLLAILANQLNSKQRAQALKRTKAASRRFRHSQSYVHFVMTGIPADRFLSDQHKAISRPVEWTLEKLWEVYAFQDREECTLKPRAVNDRLASAFRENPDSVIASAVGVLRKAGDRTTVLGAAKWLTTVGPAASSAIPAIESCGGGRFDSYIDGEMNLACRLIREAIEFDENSAAGPTDMRIARQLVEEDAPGQTLSPDAWREHLEQDDWLARFQTLTALANAGRAYRDSGSSTMELQEMVCPSLRDESHDTVSITGEYRNGDQIYQWRRQRRSVAGAAVRAMFALGAHLRSSDLFDAMLREATQAYVRCGATVIVSEYSDEEWCLACESADGGFSRGERRIRAARQQCRTSVWHGTVYDPLEAVAESHLRQVILRLSGRLVPHDEL